VTVPDASARPPAESESGHDRFLRLLDADPDIARDKYRTLLTRLVKFFEWRGCADAEDLTQITIVRVGEKLAEGLALDRDDNTPYFFAVAKYVLKEARRTAAAAAAFESAHELMLADNAFSRLETTIQLNQCLASLDAADRALFVRYYLDRERDTLCKELGVSSGALRVRIHRLMKDVRARFVRAADAEIDSLAES
jgi:RNA polymerase sigma factor (sigma-70 family)